MPTTVNGVGTHYHGKKNRQVRQGVCRACGSTASLESYDTRLWFVILFIPVIPLGRKRIIDQCSRCQRHFVAKPDEWEMAKQLNVSGAMEQYRTEPSAEAALELHGQMLGFHLHDEAARFREAALGEHPDSALLCAGLGAQMDQVGQFTQATPLFEKALALRPDLPEARVGMAFRRMNDGQLDEARELLAFLEEPGAGQLYSIGPLEQLAHAYQKAGRHDETLQICQRLLAEFPAAGQVHAVRKFVAASEKALGRRESMLPKRTFSLGGLFHGKSGTYAPWQRWAAFAGVVVVLVAIGMGLVNEYKRRHRTVYVLNDLGQAVQVSIDGGPSVTVESRSELQLAEGRHRVTVSGPVSDEFDLQMRTGYLERWTKRPAWAINVGGATALSLDTLYYAANPRPAENRLLVGEKTVYCPHVDYAFERPPDSIQVEGKNTEVVKTHLTVVEETPLVLFQYALQVVEPSAAFRFGEACLQRNPQDADLLYSYVRQAESRGQGERAETFLEQGLWRRPISIPWHRSYQSLDGLAEREEALLARYDAELAGEPENAPLLYLRGRISPDHARSVEFLRKAGQADPSLPWPWMGLAYDAASRGDWEESRTFIDKACELNLDDASAKRLRHVVRMARGDLDELESEYRKRLSSERPFEASGTLMLLCEVLSVQGRTEDAWQAFEQWRSRLPASMRSDDNLQVYRLGVRLTLGQLDAVEKILAQPPALLQADLRLCALLVLGRPADAVDDSALARTLEDPWNALAVSLAFQLSRNEAQAQTWRERACAELERQDGDGRRAAALLRGSQEPSGEQTEQIVLDPSRKALLLAALAVRFPRQKAELAPLARRLNVSRLPFYYLVNKALETQQ